MLRCWRALAAHQDQRSDQPRPMRDSSHIPTDDGGKASHGARATPHTQSSHTRHASKQPLAVWSPNRTSQTRTPPTRPFAGLSRQGLCRIPSSPACCLQDDGIRQGGIQQGGITLRTPPHTAHTHHPLLPARTDHGSNPLDREPPPDVPCTSTVAPCKPSHYLPSSLHATCPPVRPNPPLASSLSVGGMPRQLARTPPSCQRIRVAEDPNLPLVAEDPSCRGSQSAPSCRGSLAGSQSAPHSSARGTGRRPLHRQP